MEVGLTAGGVKEAGKNVSAHIKASSGEMMVRAVCAEANELCGV